MLELNQPDLFKWNILYEVPNKELKKSDIIIHGRYYDFIPEKGSMIILDNVLYSVTTVIYDFDKTNIVIGLAKLKDEA
ncbi:MAG: hypothetical protein [Wendovervirus sonii]|uniref:Uncharacterized protein n=1 Tax=phage Lak_Megaphage_Sonny TaxID=3109229 RepID=A0ABZ0Z2K8_9CAUD|nr:MAG: hypothetical protein [phage Lak_Megaphage_Sonny]